jgi:hypothetical protein
MTAHHPSLHIWCQPDLQQIADISAYRCIDIATECGSDAPRGLS